MLDKITTRAKIVFFAVVFALVMLYIMMAQIQDYADPLLETEGIDNLMGLSWVLTWAGWIAFSVVIIGFVGVMSYRIFKDRRGR